MKASENEGVVKLPYTVYVPGCHYQTSELYMYIYILFQLEKKEMLLHQLMLDKEKLKQKYSDKIAVEKERNTFETHKRLKEQEIEFKVRLRSVFNSPNWDLDVQYCNVIL